MINRRDFVLRSLGAGALLSAAPRFAHAASAAVDALTDESAPPVAMTVYKSPTCGCCKEWIKHVEKNGFKCKVVQMDDLTPIKQSAGVPLGMSSCHTALVGPYFVEGHVPADCIQKVLQTKPAIAGLAVPGMPLGSPGMEQGPDKQPYKVYAVAKNGATSVFASR